MIRPERGKNVSNKLVLKPSPYHLYIRACRDWRVQKK